MKHDYGVTLAVVGILLVAAISVMSVIQAAVMAACSDQEVVDGR